MYKRILLAYDGSLAGRTALREGAILAKRYGAQVFLLSVVADTGGLRMADGTHAGVLSTLVDSYNAVLEEGAARLKELGFTPVTKLVIGEPAQEIGAFATQVEADLVVVGHRRQSFMERWWSGSSGGYLMDYLSCNLLIGRNTITDQEFNAEMRGPVN
jgi:nucleotide-binding universal stress UspA family protein